MNKTRILDRIEEVKAKRIHVFENGNSDSFGRELLINSSRERTWNKVLTYLTQVLEPSYGIVRHLVSVDGKESIHSFSELNSGDRYVACGKEQFKKVSGGYRTLFEHNHIKKKKCAKLYPKNEKKQDVADEYWALRQAQKNKRTVIYVFSNGRKHHAPVKFVLIESDFRNWPRTLSHISNKLDKPEGIRYLYTIYGRKVCGPCEIQHGACYVAMANEEKFQKLNYMESYKNLVLFKKKSGEAINQFHIGALSSPMGLEIRNDDCFLAKYKGEDKKHKKRKTKKRSTSNSTNKSSGVSNKISSPKKKEKFEFTNTIDEAVSVLNQIRQDEEDQEVSAISEAPQTSSRSSSIAEVTVEAVGTKIVTNKQVKTKTQMTQTSSDQSQQVNSTPKNEMRMIGADEIVKKKLSNISTVIPSKEALTKSQLTQTQKNGAKQNSKFLVNSSSKGEMRIIGADEVMKKKVSNLSALSSAEEARYIEEHNRKLRETLSKLSKNSDTEIVKVRESAVSFTYCYLNGGQIIKDLKLIAIDDKRKFKNKKTLVSLPENIEDTSSKSVAILEHPVIIPYDNSSDADTVNKKRISVHQRRSTGFNMNFNKHILTLSDDEEYDDSKSDIKESEGMSDNNQQCGLSSAESQLIAIVNRSDVSAQGSDQFKEDKSAQSDRKCLITYNDAANQKTEFKDQNTQKDLAKETKSTKTINRTTTFDKDAATQDTEPLQEDKAAQGTLNELGSAKPEYSTTYQDSYNQTSKKLKEEETQKDYPKENKSANTGAVEGTDAATQGSGELKGGNAMEIEVKEMKSAETDHTSRECPLRYNDASNQKPEKFKEGMIQKDLPQQIKSTSITISSEDASTQGSEQSMEEKSVQSARMEMVSTGTDDESRTKYPTHDKQNQRTQEVIVGMVQTQNSSFASSVCPAINKETVRYATKNQEPQGTQCSKLRTSESQTTEGKRIAIASEVQELLQKEDKTVPHPIPCNKMKEACCEAVKNMQTENKTNEFTRAYETGVIKDVFCGCDLLFEQDIVPHVQTKISDNFDQISQEVQPFYNTDPTSSNIICNCSGEIISKETQTESRYFIPNDNLEQKRSTLRYYVMRTGTYNEFLEMPYEASQIDATRELLRPKPKNKFRFCQCFNFCK